MFPLKYKLFNLDLGEWSGKYKSEILEKVLIFSASCTLENYHVGTKERISTYFVGSIKEQLLHIIIKDGIR